ncbi:MAG: 4Fe-4S dicluster domain-containing protein [Erysipelotrichales bacterium]|nr:MAG: 4Fe-4S dicluster domain-containing protein [Erysipelotrichales bacterium]
MNRQMIHIESALCNGCGQCVMHCAEGAIALIEGKAQVIREDYCDGLGACLPVCPTGALTLLMRDVPAFVDPHIQTASMLNPEIKNWPVQLQLSPLTSDAYKGAHLLIAADCTAFASPYNYALISQGKPVLIVCPKFDRLNLVGRLSSIFKANEVSEISVLRMEVPCCKGLENAVSEAVANLDFPLEVTVRILTKEGSLRP